jgi:hypothetical protein
MSEFKPIEFFCQFVLRHAGVVNYVTLSLEAYNLGLRRGAEIARAYDDWSGVWGQHDNLNAAREAAAEIATKIEAEIKEQSR